ncbi:hypothetical protein N8I77_012679 [Diaporthe amygdali]|uniref:Nephrocystin 3-like N-terminal domain-containing protein n=1 Tax=Phomopsis amygdali TaxID=1214568 RepID=A0AAD9VXG0_PHOAM|nr:hypothetical protein N8I77_012679 [Diaporthe amygdali]
MDPVSAIGVAAAVVQFVDFGKRLVSRAHQIQASPVSRTERESELLLSLSELREQAVQVKQTFDRFPEAQSDQKLARIFDDVEAAANDFDAMLEGLRSRSEANANPKNKNMMQSLSVGLDSIRAEKQVQKALSRLDYIQRRGYSFTLQASKESSDRETRFGEKLDEMLVTLRQLQHKGVQPCTSDVAMGQGGLTAGLYDEQIITLLNDDSDEGSARIYKELVRGLWNSRTLPKVQRQPEKESSNREFRSAIIDSLVSGVFDNIDDRGEAIAQSYEGTFRWVFNNEPLERDGQALWSSFPAWLESKTDSLYWITGKPGSGKSTLMKYILQSPELKVCLAKWAGSCPLQITSFYAWIAGSDMQKSHLGLMRTILFQCLQADPEMVKSVAPRRWSLLSTLRSSQKQPSWQDWELNECFDILLSKFDKSGSKKLAIFIDGLDEFKVSSQRTLKLIHNISDRGNIKVCLASRQWTEFNDALDKHAMLRIQDLTENDMIHFVQGNLEANRGFSDLCKTFPQEARSLVQDTVEKSSGVFLWAALVTKRLLQLLSAGDGLPQLRKVLEDLPDDIERLFSTLWDSIEGNKLDSAELIALKKAAYPELNFLTLWLAHGGFEQHLELATLSEDARSGVRGTMVRRLESKTRGLLELSPKGNVEFIHRTASDWVARDDVWSEISLHLSEAFDPCLNLLHAEALRVPERLDESWFRHHPQETIQEQMHQVLRYSVGVINPATTELSPALVKALDDMDKCVREQAEQTLRNVSWSYVFGCDFFGLIARYCFIPYLNAKLKTTAHATQMASILENAIFGHELTLTAADLPFELRRKTVAFLLDKGASLRELRHSKRK